MLWLMFTTWIKRDFNFLLHKENAVIFKKKSSSCWSFYLVLECVCFVSLAHVGKSVVRVSFLGSLCVAAEGAVRTTWLTLPCVTLCGLVIYYKWYCILSVDSLPTLSIGKAGKVVCQLLAPSNPRLPRLAALKVKGTAADSTGKSLMSQRVSPAWSSAVHPRAAGEAAGCREDLLKASAASYSRFPLQNWHLLTAQLLCRFRAHRKDMCELMQLWRQCGFLRRNTERQKGRSQKEKLCLNRHRGAVWKDINGVKSLRLYLWQVLELKVTVCTHCNHPH